MLVDTVYENCTNYFGYQLIVASLLFAVQIYCDFMGYSIIAKGAARVLGYDLMDNFQQPYLATSVREFWRRWHISLSTWLRDYLYIPLGGNRGSKIRKYRNLLLTFLASGLWHGAGLTFVFWGGLHAVYQIAEEVLQAPCLRLCQKLRIRTDTFSWRLLQTLRTFVMVDIAWVFFRAPSLKGALYILRNSLRYSNLGQLLGDGLCQLGLDAWNLQVLGISLLVLLLCSLMQAKGVKVLEWLKKQNAWLRYTLYWGAILMLLFSLDITGQEFLYFQF